MWPLQWSHEKSVTENKDRFFQLLFYAVSHLDGSVPRFASYKVSFIGWVLIPLAEVNLEIQGEIHWVPTRKWDAIVFRFQPLEKWQCFDNFSVKWVKLLANSVWLKCKQTWLMRVSSEATVPLKPHSKVTFTSPLPPLPWIPAPSAEGYTNNTRNCLWCGE